MDQLHDELASLGDLLGRAHQADEALLLGEADWRHVVIDDPDLAAGRQAKAPVRLPLLADHAADHLAVHEHVVSHNIPQMAGHCCVDGPALTSPFQGPIAAQCASEPVSVGSVAKASLLLSSVQAAIRRPALRLFHRPVL